MVAGFILFAFGILFYVFGGVPAWLCLGMIGIGFVVMLSQMVGKKKE
jgi:hypothetical protein